MFNIGDNDWAKLAEDIELSARTQEKKDYALCLKELQAGLGSLLDEI